ncbi:hypothetical protein ACFX13_026497 [Malus domestica]
MIDIYSIMDQFTEAEKLYVKLKSSGIVLDMIAYSIAVRMYVKAGSLEDACSVLDAMEKQEGIIPDIYMFLDEISEILDEMLQRGFVPNTITFNVMLDVYGKAKFLKKARELFRMAQK